MKIVICGSSTFKADMIAYRDQLLNLGHEPVVHPDYELFLKNEKPEVWRQVTGGEHHLAKREQGYIKWYYQAIANSDAILVLNFDKNGIKNYIGGNTLMEIAFAHVNNKKIFLLHEIPEDISYVDEIKAMVEETQILANDLNKIA